MRLSTGQKLGFFRLIIRDKGNRVPVYVKIIPILLVVYLSVPFDIIPDFVPVLGYLDDVAVAPLAVALIMRFLPTGVLLELLGQAKGTGAWCRLKDEVARNSSGG